MYKCLDCDMQFNEPNKFNTYDIPNIDAYTGMSRKEPHYVCPYCGSEDIDELKRCACGEWTETENDFCEDCRDYISDYVSVVLGTIETDKKLNYRQALDLLNYELEGR